ncbi:MAG: diguanylate cyclase [Actinobacteria bacterium]|nr:diguanylate cyclase [Cyanobacteriota bacterium]MCL5772364.1 diguanylate cyclase [Actinomycetota bacterium]
MKELNNINTFSSSDPLYFQIIDKIREGILVIDNNFKIKFANNGFLKLYLCKFEDIVGKNFFDIVGEENISSWQKAFKEDNEYKLYINELSISLNNKEKLKIRISISSLVDQNGENNGKIILISDVTDEKILEEQIKYLGFHDALTGLYNRSYFEEEFKRLDNSRNYPLGIIMGDLNGFKLINDVFGHLKGDDVLKQVAEILVKSCRKSDIVSRYGGDEFIILLPKADSEVLQNITERIKKACREFNAESSFITISTGNAIKETDNIDMEGLLIEAENAMYNAKIDESKEAKELIIKYLEKKYQERRENINENLNRKLLIAERLAKSLGLSSKNLTELKLLIKLHDIGMIIIPDYIINKPGFLTPKEKKLIEKHSEAGYRIAESTGNLAAIADAILHHHENWDGSGYPKGLKGENIPLLSRIAAIIDAYDAMASDRPYRKALPINKVKNEFEKSKGKQFDPYLVDCILYYLNF